jgi:hypothetical protein
LTGTTYLSRKIMIAPPAIMADLTKKQRAVDHVSAFSSALGDHTIVYHMLVQALDHTQAGRGEELRYLDSEDLLSI